MPQGFVHQAAAQPAAAVTGVYQHPSDGCLGADDPCGDDPQECDDAAVLLRPEKDALRIDLVGVGFGDVLFEEKDGFAGLHDAWGWPDSWYIFAGYALVVAVVFALVFKYKHNPAEMASVKH